MLTVLFGAALRVLCGYEFCMDYMIGMADWFLCPYAFPLSDCPGSSDPRPQAHTPWPAGWCCRREHCRGLAPGLLLARLPVSVLRSSGQSAGRILSSFTFTQQLNSSCTNTYTLSQACINDFVAEDTILWEVEVAMVAVVLRVETLMWSGSFKAGCGTWNYTSWTGPNFRKCILKCVA